MNRINLFICFVLFLNAETLVAGTSFPDIYCETTDYRIEFYNRSAYFIKKEASSSSDKKGEWYFVLNDSVDKLDDIEDVYKFFYNHSSETILLQSGEYYMGDKITHIDGVPTFMNSYEKKPLKCFTPLGTPLIQPPPEPGHVSICDRGYVGDIITRAVGASRCGSVSPQKMAELKKLGISGNGGILRFTTETFSGLKSLQDLWIQGNRQLSFKEGALDNLHQLKNLSIEGNKYYGLDHFLFEKLSSLERLSLQQVGIGVLEKNTLANLRNLKLLVLFMCNVKVIEDNAFQNLSSLETIILTTEGEGDLDFSRLNKDTFNGLLNLKSLIFDGYGWEGTAKLEEWTQPLSSIEELTVSGMWLGTLRRSNFKHLTSLRRLSLLDGRISSIEDGAFLDLGSLTKLWFRVNGIDYISKSKAGLSPDVEISGVKKVVP